MSEKEKIILALQSLGLGIEYKNSGCYDEIAIYDFDKYLGSLYFLDDKLVVDFL